MKYLLMAVVVAALVWFGFSYYLADSPDATAAVAQPVKPAPSPVPSALPPPSVPPSIAVRKQVGTQASAAAPTAPARNEKANVKIDLLQALGANNHFHDDAVGISVQLPKGWKVLDAVRWGEGHRQNTVFMAPDGDSTKSSMYYKQYTPEERSSLAGTGAEALLREQAQKKEASRVAGTPDYRNVPESFSYFDVNGSPALTYFATYTHEGEVMTEHFTRVLGPNGYVMFFTNGRFEDVKALMPQLKQAASSVRGP